MSGSTKITRYITVTSEECNIFTVGPITLKISKIHAAGISSDPSNLSPSRRDNYIVDIFYEDNNRKTHVSVVLPDAEKAVLGPSREASIAASAQLDETPSKDTYTSSDKSVKAKRRRRRKDNAKILQKTKVRYKTWSAIVEPIVKKYQGEIAKVGTARVIYVPLHVAKQCVEEINKACEKIGAHFRIV